MCLLKLAVLSIVINAACGVNLVFPNGFQFGAGTAAYQTEGAWNVSDKGESIWDRFTHEQSHKIADGSNGDVAGDSYHRWREDVQAAVDIGLDYYRFSISWPRMMPDGFSHYVSADGTRYYNELIDELLRNGIEPKVTLYHWDLPQSLQDLGGWANPLIVEWFGDYARSMFTLYGDRVKVWFTINEPLSVCDPSYNLGLVAPGLIDYNRGVYLCSKYMILAHAKAWRIYDEDFRGKQGGKVAMVNHLVWMEPKSSSPEDEEVAELARQFSSGRFLHPIYSKEGGWPPVLEQIIAENSRKEGYSKSRLPAFTEEEKVFVRGTYDFLGVNYYTGRVARWTHPGEEVPLALTIYGIPEFNITMELIPGTEHYYSLLPPYPVGLRRQLAWLKQQYGDVEIMISENGCPTEGAPGDEERSIQYVKDHLEQILLSRYEDGVNVVAYTSWSLVDVFEWIDGYRTKFGLYGIDMSDPLRRRRPRPVSVYYASVISNRTLDINDI